MKNTVFKEKTVFVDAIQYTGSNTDEVINFIKSKDLCAALDGGLLRKINEFEPVNKNVWFIRHQELGYKILNNTDFVNKYETI